MSNRKETLEIIERLQNAPEMELMQHDVEEMLERELAKPEAEVDAQLVQELMDLLENREVNGEEKKAAWTQLEQKLPAKRSRPIVKWVSRIAACAAVIIAVMFAAYGTAQAFHWEFLLKLLRPVAETFMLYSSNQDGATQAPQQVDAYQQGSTGIRQAQYNSVEECPLTYEGYRVQPVWMPERFAFLQGMLYQDEFSAVITNVHHSEGGICILTVTLFNGENTKSSYEYEKTLNDPMTHVISNHEVTYYHNYDDAMRSASWVMDKAHYSVTGAITEDEMVQVIQTIIEAPKD